MNLSKHASDAKAAEIYLTIGIQGVTYIQDQSSGGCKKCLKHRHCLGPQFTGRPRSYRVYRVHI